MLLDQNVLLDHVRHECSEDTKEIILCSAFLKKNVLQELEDVLNLADKVQVYVRWQELDLLSKVSDLDIYEVCKRNGWELFYNKKLHAKFFLIDEKSLFLGSSNYTLSGTGRGNKNIEWNKSTQIDEYEAIDLKKSISLSIPVTDDLYRELKNRIEQLEPLAKQIEEVQTADTKPLYNFNFDWLPPFSPKDLFTLPLDSLTVEYMRKFEVTSINSLDPFKEFVLNNPITELIRNYHSTVDPIARWGSIRDKIKNDEYLFSLCKNNNVILEKELYTHNRLFHLFYWLAEFDESLELYMNDRYLEDPRRGTCSINETQGNYHTSREIL